MSWRNYICWNSACGIRVYFEISFKRAGLDQKGFFTTDRRDFNERAQSIWASAPAMDGSEFCLGGFDYYEDRFISTMGESLLYRCLCFFSFSNGKSASVAETRVSLTRTSPSSKR